jgi:hypothetical protein
VKLSAVFVQPKLTATFTAPSFQTTTGIPVAREYVERPIYEGATEVTPSATEQVLQTKNFRMTENITINPIPSNYGLITWDGSTITVS